MENELGKVGFKRSGARKSLWRAKTGHRCRIKPRVNFAKESGGEGYSQESGPKGDRENFMEQAFPGKSGRSTSLGKIKECATVSRKKSVGTEI